jgi:hypothetical protein
MPGYLIRLLAQDSQALGGGRARGPAARPSPVVHDEGQEGPGPEQGADEDGPAHAGGAV